MIYDSSKKGLIIDITDIYEHRDRKKQELEFYNKELAKLQDKLVWINREIDVTETIIKMIEHEEVTDLVELIKEKKSKE